MITNQSRIAVAYVQNRDVTSSLINSQARLIQSSRMVCSFVRGWKGGGLNERILRICAESESYK